MNYHYPQYQLLFLSQLILISCILRINKLKRFWPISPESIDSELFYVEQLSNEASPPRPNTPIDFNSTQISGNNTRELITLSIIALRGPQIVTIDFDWNELTMPFRCGRQLTTIPPSRKDLNLLPNPFSHLANLAVANPTTERCEENTASNQRNGRNFHRYRRPEEPQHNWGKGDTANEDGWQYNLLWW